jgi:hypothetical protein
VPGQASEVINSASSRRVTPTVLSVTAITLDCGHSPFLSVLDPLVQILLASA